jgi:hypothetical protein
MLAIVGLAGRKATQQQNVRQSSQPEAAFAEIGTSIVLASLPSFGM